ncbi:LPS assembly protein LptD [Aliiglaciecola sp. LCG003]|uniref:LPS-assembly protein LptD n=1 Tax=Aliiglaciecola sp. LCG003 TaxID=3053655 RepID=UPI002572DD9E|nr:LPS assembly protein LptD [Aliiglaciecola sp. LCG003]WJG10188.1 LPS assembly protein LptD [Aliiglaciecola sp. LCG003]
MQINQLSLLLFTLSSGTVLAQSSTSCPTPVAGYIADEKILEDQIRVRANRAEIQQNNLATFDGKVNIVSDKAQITANKAVIDKANTQLNATGNVSYHDSQMRVQSTDVLLNTDSGKLAMSDTEYQLTQFGGRGAADLIEIDQNKGVALTGVSYTTCPIGAEDWKINASSISIEQGKLWGEAINTVFYVKDVPVFYLPYFIFPVSNQRQSGFLFPEINTSSATGLSYEQPFYWNIAPNYDATFTPRVMSKRGVQLKTNFRYLNEQSLGQVNIEYLPNDQETIDDRDRYFYRYTHNGKLNDNWLLNIDFNGLSDDNYIADFGSDFYNRADTHLYKTLSLNYYSDNIDFSVNFRDFEVIGDHQDNYRALPEMKFNYLTEQFGSFEFSLASELAYFDNKLAEQPTATRFHLAPTIALPLRSQWGEFLAEATWLNTYYNQDNIDGTGLAEETTRSLGQSRVFGALYFDRDTSWLGSHLRQTLEPKIQYLYTSYKDQNNIGLYDTTRLLNDFNGLFRGQEFTGLDRISDNNQITVGLTTRILDENSREQFKLSLGQIFYLEDNKVLAASKDDDRSALASELDWQIGSKWFAHTELQLSTKTDKVERSSISLEYQLSEDKIVQINHRFVRNLSGEQIDQFGVTASWPITENWHWVGRWYKDLSSQRTIESYAGVQYESCCWSISLVSQRHLSNRFDVFGQQNSQEFESSINLKFSFKFSGTEARSGRRNMLEDGLFGYKQAYLIN